MFNLGTIGNMQVGDVVLAAIVTLVLVVALALGWNRLGGGNERK